MKVFFTKEFRNNAFLAENGIKFILHGFALLTEFDEVNVSDLRLQDIVENYSIITNERKDGTDLIDNLFDVAYIPTLELKTETGERFGGYKFRINKDLNSEAASKGTALSTNVDVKAIILVGESYTEESRFIKTKNKSFLAAVLTPDGDDWNLTDGKSRVINLQLSLGFNDVSECSKDASFDKECYSANSGPYDQETVNVKTRSMWLVPSASEQLTPYRDKSYNDIVKRLGLAQEYIEQIEYLPYTFNLVPVTDKNDAIYNINARFNVWDDHKDRCVKPQMLLSYGADDNQTGEIGVTVDKQFFAMNEKAGEGTTRFDLFGRDDYFTSEDFDAPGSCRIIGSNDILTSAVDNFLYNTKKNDLNASASIFMHAGNNTFKTVDGAGIYGADGLTADKVSNMFSVNSRNEQYSDSQNVMSIGADGKDPSDYYTHINNSTNITIIGQNSWTKSDFSDNAIFIGHKGLTTYGKHRGRQIPVVFGKYNANDPGVVSAKAEGDMHFLQNEMFAVGDGYFNPGMITNKDTFNYDELTSATPATYAKDYADIIKRLNVFSVESQSHVPYIHYNDYDDPELEGDADRRRATTSENLDFFGVRSWHNDKDTPSGYLANELQTLFTPNAIYYTKPHAHREEWKMRFKEITNFLSDNYIANSDVTLETYGLDTAISTGIKGTNVFTLPLEPKYHYRWTNGTQVIEGYTKGLCGTFGVKGLIKQQQTTRQNWDLKILESDNVITLADIVRAVNAEYGREIGYDGINGKDSIAYTMLCYNATNANVYIKGIRLRKTNKGNQTLSLMKGVAPAATQRVIYQNNGQNAAFGAMNFDYAQGDSFAT